MRFGLRDIRYHSGMSFIALRESALERAYRRAPEQILLKAAKA
jgi:hypothetical protein